jgi:hypothetical protein
MKPYTYQPSLEGSQTHTEDRKAELQLHLRTHALVYAGGA